MKEVASGLIKESREVEIPFDGVRNRGQCVSPQSSQCDNSCEVLWMAPCGRFHMRQRYPGPSSLSGASLSLSSVDFQDCTIPALGISENCLAKSIQKILQKVVEIRSEWNVTRKLRRGKDEVDVQAAWAIDRVEPASRSFDAPSPLSRPFSVSPNLPFSVRDSRNEELGHSHSLSLQN